MILWTKAQFLSIFALPFDSIKKCQFNFCAIKILLQSSSSFEWKAAEAFDCESKTDPSLLSK